MALRFSIQKFDHEGFTNDLAIPGFRLDDQHDVSGKVAWLWRPNDHFSATVTAQGYYADQHGDAQKNIIDTSPGPGTCSRTTRPISSCRTTCST